MKVLRITTHWTAEEADCIYQLLDEFKSVIWEHYGDEIIEMHKVIQLEQQGCEGSQEFNDDLPF